MDYLIIGILVAVVAAISIAQDARTRANKALERIAELELNRER